MTPTPMAKEIITQANEYVNHVENQWRKTKWEEYQVYSECEEGEEPANDVLCEIAIEQDRTNPQSSLAWDHEELWRATGKYYTIKREAK